MIDAGLPVRAFFTTRDGGTSAPPYDSLNLATHVGDDPACVARNRSIVAEHADAPVTFLTAEHGIAVAQVSAPREDPGPADVLVTRVPGLAIAAIAADCVPVLMHDELTGAVAAVHAGREGLYLGAIDAAVAALLDLGPARREPGTLRAAIGPAICGRCYEVPGEMQARVAGRHPTARAMTRTGTPSLDLPRAIETRLGELGFREVIRRPECTREEPGLFSHRRDGVTGRIAGVIVCAGPGVSLR
ncbi:peptidoglycan editing factor PgeF [Demequina sp. SYSU T00039]|uniref:Purine nucleoside phosphorylase n=1 Tax=Demequina lignilytica TaxID=3051663 RepID=A0AAW7M3X4_9MICO|nr:MULTISPECIES: peptidoglycan editing factor PgeF [unclassified Demequina]MDN4477110.1 peptidoglycan editing factor PgeF [Demequina sp. SYSU T00039-1]MDN4487283.1 peptidoglycan editing factor PgeF [Demequina sp. SYSU T00039]MDN4491534.1 peptidoglycan editing factor PgeF [Demequina sp. SYSU T00068]